MGAAIAKAFALGWEVGGRMEEEPKAEARLGYSCFSSAPLSYIIISHLLHNFNSISLLLSDVA